MLLISRSPVRLLTVVLGLLAVCLQGGCRTVNAVPTRALTVANQTVCYQAVGCFDNNYPFNNTESVLPNSPEIVGIKFWLYTRDSNPDYMSLHYDGEGVQQNLYNSERQLKVLIHGFNNNGTLPWVQQMKNALLKMDNVNVIIVSWEGGAAFPDYYQAVANTRLVAKQISLLLDLLEYQSGLQLSDVHMIGHSLGAHVSGYVGASFKGKIGRISGLDPAEPSYENLDEAVRLNKEDALFVDVIHTNAAPLHQGGAGLFQESGHVDFYPNGGLRQPGCPTLLNGLILGGIAGSTDLIKDIVSCAHSRAYIYYTESILEGPAGCPFQAYPCENYKEFEKGRCLTCGNERCSRMGYYSQTSLARGARYLATGNSSPFCGESFVVNVTTVAEPGSVRPIKGSIDIILQGSLGAETLQYRQSYDLLNYGNEREAVVLKGWKGGDLSLVQITYTKYNGLRFLNWDQGVDQFTLNNLTITAPSGKKYTACSAISVQSGQMATVTLC